MQNDLNPLYITDSQLSANAAAQKNKKINSGSNIISDIGTALNLPSVFDTNSDQAKSDVLSGATDIFGNVKRDVNSSAYKSLYNKVAYVSDGRNYNAFGDDITQDLENQTSSDANSGMTQDQYNQMVYNQTLAQNNALSQNEKASYQNQIDNLDRLLGHTATLKQQAMQGAEDQYASTKSKQEKIFNDQRTQNIQNQEKGYNEVGNFANTSYNNLNRLLQGANAGRSSVGQILAPFMVGKASDTRRKAVTDTAGENMRNIDTTAETTFNDLLNAKKKSLQGYETDFGNTAQDLTNQKYQAQLGRDMSNGSTYAQARAGATSLENDMTNRYAQLAGLFDKYKPNYTTKEAPALSTYQVDPAQINAGQNSAQDNSFYLNMLKRKKDLGL